MRFATLGAGGDNRQKVCVPVHLGVQKKTSPQTGKIHRSSLRCLLVVCLTEGVIEDVKLVAGCSLCWGFEPGVNSHKHPRLAHVVIGPKKNERTG